MPAPNEPSSPSKPLRFGPDPDAETSRSLQVPPPSVSANPLAAPEPDPAVAPAYEFLGHLPESYGSRKLFLVARDPNILFAYWDLNREQYLSAAEKAKDGKLFLEVFVPGEGRVQQIHVWENHKNWYLQVNRPDTTFMAHLGYYLPQGGFEVLARSPEVRTPRDTLSPNTHVQFVTIPFHLSFRELKEIIVEKSEPGEDLAETLSRLEETNYPLPFEAHFPKDLVGDESQVLLEYMAGDEVRRKMVGSFEITEILRKRYETTLGSVPWTTSSGGWVTSMSSPFGASFGARPRDFHMHVNAELIIYGGTKPTAKVRINGEQVALTKDGAFSYHFVFPDGQFHIPVEATSADGVEMRSALLSFLRMTERAGDVRSTAQPKIDEPLGRE